MNNTTYMLNAKKSTWECDVYMDNDDTKINFKSLGNNIYRLQLNSVPDRYLTANGTASGSKVNWQLLNTASDAQKWKLELVEDKPEPDPDPGPSGDSKTLSFPSGPNCNWNQKCQEVTNLFDAKACTLVSGLDAANFYATDGVGFRPADMKAYWDSTGYTWEIPGPGAIGAAVTGLSSEAAYLAVIKQEIDLDHPLLVNIGPKSHNHTIFAYGYKNNAASRNDILVYDPANTADTNSIYGLPFTLKESMDWNSREYDRHNLRNMYKTYRK